MRVALVYDRVNKWGGAERVLLVLHEMFPEASLYTSLYDTRRAGWAGVFPEVIPSFLNRLAFTRSNHEYLSPFMPFVFESYRFDGYDLVISVTSEFAKGIVTGPDTRHICYCLTPTRYLWSGHGEYFSNKFLRAGARPIVNYLRNWDKRVSSRSDVMVAISCEVRDRIKRYYDRDAQVIHPPVDFLRSHHEDSLLRGSAASRSRSLDANFFLMVSRLVKYKRVDLAVKAFNKLGLPLVVVGVGREESYLKKLAKTNIKFSGSVSDRELAGIYLNCRALIHPQIEDFGLAAVEAQMFGKPVIAFGKGGVRDTVVNNTTGVYFHKQTVDDIVHAVKKFDRMRFSTAMIKKNAKRFSKERFKREFMKII